MPANEEGEFELVLGNRQLLSVFLIIVVLLFIFFEIGYVVGRNVAMPPREHRSSGTPINAAKPQVVEPSAGVSTPKGAVASQPPVETMDTPSPTPQTIPAGKPSEPLTSEPFAVPPSSAASPPPGAYLQVSATKKWNADHLAASLAMKGFPARLAPVPGSDLVRVLVGPLPDSTQLANTREALLALGLKSFPRRY